LQQQANILVRARRLKSGALIKTYFGDFFNRRGGDEE